MRLWKRLTTTTRRRRSCWRMLILQWEGKAMEE
jgi:hypothetical protein